MTPPPTRRRLLELGLALTAGATFAPSATRAAAPSPDLSTPPQILGPYYPSASELTRVFPEDLNNDLVELQGRPGQAEGVQMYVVGRVIDGAGAPVAGAVLETWQTCHRGRYLHPADDYGQDIPPDPGFQYFGRATADTEGRYALRTVMPRAYPSGASREWWRPPHVHFRVTVAGSVRLVTQLYFDDPHDLDNAWKHRAIQGHDRLLDNVVPERRHELICVLGLAADAPELPDWLAACGLGLHLTPEASRWGPPRSGRFDMNVG